jgi:hypothetical protein
MDTQVNFKQYIISAAMLFAGIQAEAQKADNDIQGLSTDANYNNTTVVYKREAANDLEVLAKMGGGFGLGDMVRVTTAPPKPAPTEALNTAPKTVAAPAPAIKVAKPAAPKPQETVAKPIEAPVQKAVAPVAAPAAIMPVNMVNQVSAESAVTATAKAAEAPKQAAAPQLTPAPKKATTTTGSKSTAKKSVKKSHHSKHRGGFKLFNRKFNPNKHGKQRYSCPKF